jgi:hypothetical protein
LDSLALELLRGRFPNVDVEPYYRLAEGYVEDCKSRCMRRMEGKNPFESLINL